MIVGAVQQTNASSFWMMGKPYLKIYAVGKFVREDFFIYNLCHLNSSTLLKTLGMRVMCKKRLEA